MRSPGTPKSCVAGWVSQRITSAGDNVSPLSCVVSSIHSDW